MRNLTKKIVKNTAVAGCGGLIYLVIELLWRGRTSLSMFFLGALCFFILGIIQKKSAGVPVFVKALTGACIITVLEFIFGCILNLYLRLDVWSYYDRPFNILGQVCLLYFVLWLGLSGICFKAYDKIYNAVV